MLTPPPGGAAAISSARLPSPKSSSQRTLRWRKPDSNPRSRPAEGSVGRLCKAPVISLPAQCWSEPDSNPRSPPVRIWSSSGDGIRQTAPTTAKPARTARSASSSWAPEYRNRRARRRPYISRQSRRTADQREYRPGWLTLLSRSAEATLFAGQFGRVVHAWRTCSRHQIRSHSRFAMMPTLASIAAAASRQMSSR